MKALTDLRREALAKRDKVIARAKDEYANTLQRIAELEQQLTGKYPVNHKSMSVCMDALIPKDTTFTTTDMLAGLLAMDPGRIWRQRAIGHQIQRLCKRGIVRRVRRACGRGPAVYVRVGVKIDPLPFEGMTLVDIVAEMLKHGPLTATDIALRMIEAGYETTMPGKALRDAVGVQLRRGRNRFIRNGDRWRLGE